MPNSSAILLARDLTYGETDPYEDEDFDSLVWLWHTYPNGDEKIVGARMMDIWNRRNADQYAEMISEATGWEYDDVFEVLLKATLQPDAK